MNRLEQVRRHVDVASQRGLEIGPLVDPIITPDVGSIYYADHASTEELRRKYAGDPAVDENKIAPVDFVWGAQTLAEAAASAAPFDYVVASHVIEHVPDIVGWLAEIAEVLTPGGRICLVIPDRRLTFDVRRRPSDLADMVEAHLLHLRRPAVRAIFDHFSRHVDVDTVALWHGAQAYPEETPINLAQGWDFAKRAAQTDAYLDTHCWVFSDAEFVQLMGDLMRMNLVDFRFIGFTPALTGDFEFFAVLEVLDQALSPAEKVAVALDSLPGSDAMATVPLRSPDPGPVGSDKIAADTLSERERALIYRKRWTMAKARALIRRVRDH